MDIWAEIFALGEQPVEFERGTPEQNWQLLERIRSEPLLKALTTGLNPSGGAGMLAENLNGKFLEMARLFEHHGVKAMLIGAYAVAAFGHVRNTKDIDFWVEASPENAARVLAALTDFGAVGTFSLEKLSREDNIVHLSGDGWAIDILTGVRWPKFAACYERAISTPLSGVILKVVSLEDLIVMKKYAGRPQDLADVAMLELKVLELKRAQDQE
jgi:predicted nucleotidyltransferase